jgi:hypothetical protein
MDLRLVAAIVLVITTGYTAGAATTIAAMQHADNSSTYQLTCSQSVPENQETGKDQLRSQLPTTSSPKSPETKVNYRSDSEQVKVDVDAVSQPEGTSMEPAIYSGNTVLLQSYTSQDLEAGQIIRYDSEGGHVIHRITSSYDDTRGYVITKGDNTRGTEKVSLNDITHITIGVLYT